MTTKVTHYLSYNAILQIYENRCKDVASVKELTESGTNTVIVESTKAGTGDPLKQLESSDTSKSIKIELTSTKSVTTKDQTTQTEEANNTKQNTPKVVEKEDKTEDSGWNITDSKETKSIAEQVAEVAQDALKESGMVYVESAGMYYDYKTGYYYSSVNTSLFISRE